MRFAPSQRCSAPLRLPPTSVTTELGKPQRHGRVDPREALATRLQPSLLPAGYFSTAQAIDLDSIRYSIDMVSVANFAPRDPALTAHVERPPHGSVDCHCLEGDQFTGSVPAQYLHERSEESFNRVSRSWRRSAWRTFFDCAEHLRPLGSYEWRRSNRVMSANALDALVYQTRALRKGLRILHTRRISTVGTTTCMRRYICTTTQTRER